MADKPKPADGLKDLKWFFIILGAMFFLWLLTGGPARYMASQVKPFITPPDTTGTQMENGPNGMPN